MPETIDPLSSDLAERLRRWIIFVGYLLGGWAIANSVFQIAAWGLPFQGSFMMSIRRPAVGCYLVAPALLVTGCWGLQQHKRWARPVLLTYAGMWFAGVFGIKLVQFIATLSMDDLTSRQRFGMALGSFDLLVYSIVYPVALVLCLTRPEIRDQFPEFRRGFSPIFRGDLD